MSSASLKHLLARKFSITEKFLPVRYKETSMTGMREARNLSSHPRDAADEAAVQAAIKA